MGLYLVGAVAPDGTFTIKSSGTEPRLLADWLVLGVVLSSALPHSSLGFLTRSFFTEQSLIFKEN